MKKQFVLTLTAASAALLLGGCVLGLGTGNRTTEQKPTIGQQLIDLKKAKDTGSMTDAEYQAQKAKVLDSK